jgi:hypothetical protein
LRDGGGTDSTPSPGFFWGKPSQCDFEGFGFSPEDILQDKIMGYEK